MYGVTLASMGPRILIRGNMRCPGCTWLLHVYSFNGAADFNPRKFYHRIVQHTVWLASMGPRILIRGNLEGGTAKINTLASFNGAADFNPRKYAMVSLPIRHITASMGPRILIRGNTDAGPAAKNSAMLQWGRGF